jgi:hypothetical protein
MNQHIKFDGAGFPKAESAGEIGNCRIRGLIETRFGTAFIEMTAVIVSKYAAPKLQEE